MEAPEPVAALAAPAQPAATPVDPPAPRRVVVALQITGYSKMLHGWDGAEPIERGSSTRTFGPGSHVVELYHEGKVQLAVPVVVRVGDDGGFVVEVGGGATRRACVATGGRVNVVYDLQRGPRCG